MLGLGNRLPVKEKFDLSKIKSPFFGPLGDPNCQTGIGRETAASLILDGRARVTLIVRLSLFPYTVNNFEVGLLICYNSSV
jgi:hypothetical protein